MLEYLLKTWDELLWIEDGTAQFSSYHRVCPCADWPAPGRLCRCIAWVEHEYIHSSPWGLQNDFVYFVNVCVSYDQIWCFISVPIYFIAPTLYHLLHGPLTFHGLVLLTRVPSILWLWYFVIVRVKFILESRSHLQHSARPYVVVSLLTCVSSMIRARVIFIRLFFSRLNTSSPGVCWCQI